MNDQFKNCDGQMIDDFLNERCTDQATTDLEQHLEICDVCRRELDRRAAEPELWQEAAELLQSLSGSDLRSTEELRVSHQHLEQTIVNWLAPTDDPEMLGRLGDFEVSGIVGVGGMGAVLKGFDRSLMRVVAIKVMAPHLANNGTARNRFLREGRAAAAVTHDNVIDIHRVAETNGLPYLVMPFARGPSLQKRIQDGGPLTALEVVRIGRQIASGLAAAHEQGLVHRDIKPANIMLNDGIERVLITDFGLARAIDDASMTQTGVLAGTPQFMSPEQARGEAADSRSDLFSLGMVMYAACTGRPPFRAEAAYGILRRITDSDPRPIQEVNPDIPDWLCAIIDRLMAKHPADRFQDATEVAQLLEKCVAHLQQPAQVALPDSLAQWHPAGHAKPGFSKVSRQRIKTGTWIMLSCFLFFATCLAAFQLTSTPDITGDWIGEKWQQIKLNSNAEADNWYSGTFIDDNGKSGALHLEWSPLERRFRGRWTTGKELSGSITLRRDSDSLLRGAILVDSDSSAKPDRARLRDFAWNRGRQASASNPIGGLPRASLPKSRSRVVVSPVKGKLIRFSKGLKVGKKVRKGDFLVEIDPAASATSERLNAQLTQLKLSLESTLAELAAYNDNSQALKQAMDFANKAAVSLAEAAEAKWKQKRELLSSYEAKTVQAKSNYQRKKTLFDSGAGVSESELQKSEQAVQIADAELSSAVQEVVVLQKEWEAKQAEAEEKRQLAIVRVESQESKTVNAEKKATALRRQIKDIEVQLGSMERLGIFAPKDGVITNLPDFYIQMPIQEGDLIVTIHNDAESKETTTPPRTSTTLRGEEPLRSPPSRILAIETLGNTLESASNLDQRIRKAKFELEDIDANIDRLNRYVNDFMQAIAHVEKNIEKLERNSKGEVNELNQLKKTLADRQNSLAASQLELKGVQRSKERVLMALRAAEREQETTIRLLAAEYESTSKQLSIVKQQLEGVESRHKSGDATLSSVLEARREMEQVETRLKQQSLWLEHFNSLGHVTGSAPPKTP